MYRGRDRRRRRRADGRQERGRPADGDRRRARGAATRRRRPWSRPHDRRAGSDARSPPGAARPRASGRSPPCRSRSSCWPCCSARRSSSSRSCSSPARSSTGACRSIAYGALHRRRLRQLRRRSSSTLVNSTPLVLGGLAVGLGFKAGLFNIGAQGQFLIGRPRRGHRRRLAGAMRRPSSRSRWPRSPGSSPAALWGFIPGFLKAVSGAHEVVTHDHAQLRRRRSSWPRW